MINADVNAKIQGICDPSIWNPSNCVCECYKSCYVGNYLDEKHD